MMGRTTWKPALTALLKGPASREGSKALRMFSKASSPVTNPRQRPEQLGGWAPSSAAAGRHSQELQH